MNRIKLIWIVLATVQICYKTYSIYATIPTDYISGNVLQHSVKVEGL